jgi:hypothetical protein
MKPIARTDLITWLCAALVGAPVVVFSPAGFGLVLFAPDQFGSPAGLGAPIGVFGFLPILAVEYFAIVKFSPRATAYVHKDIARRPTMRIMFNV